MLHAEIVYGTSRSRLSRARALQITDTQTNPTETNTMPHSAQITLTTLIQFSHF